MDIPIEPDLRSICQDIQSKTLELSQWSEIESVDTFQQGNFVGSFDADEQEFCLSYFAPNKIEYWFQFSLETAQDISKGNSPVLVGRLAE